MNDSEFQELIQPLIDDVENKGKDYLDEQRVLIPIIPMTVQGMEDDVNEQVKTILDAGIAPGKLLEVVYQLSLVVGKLKVERILKKIFETFLELQIEVEPTKLNNDKTFGRETQAKLYGTEIRNLLSALPDKAGDFIADSLSTHFFDDFYVRETLTVKEREKYELLALITLNVDFQIAAHSAGSLKAGNTESELIWSAIQLLPYIGFPLVINSVQKIHAAEIELKK